MTVTLLGATEIRRLATELDVTPDEEARPELRRRREHRAQDRARRPRAAGGARRRGRARARLADPRDPRGRGIASPPSRSITASPHARADGWQSTASSTGRSRSSMLTRCASPSSRRADRARREPAVQRLGAGAAALPRALRLPAARRRDGAGRGRRAPRREARLEDLRLPEREGRLVRRRGGSPETSRVRCSGRFRTSTACWSDSTGPQGERGSEDERRRTFQIVDAAFNQRRKMLRQALSGVFGSSGRGIRGADRPPAWRRRPAARTSRSRTITVIALYAATTGRRRRTNLAR